jgi:predicted GNAT family N-acyltransferase
MENVQIIVTDWATDRDRMRAIRYPVFVLEQAVPETLEQDAHDAVSSHVIAVLEGVDVGTGRLAPDGHLGRVAVLKDHRGRGVGRAIMQALIRIAKDQSFPEVELSSQIHALGFYQGLGFEVSGEPFLEAGIPHLRMRLNL